MRQVSRQLTVTLLIVGLLTAPVVVFAAGVQINEIAWMGDDRSYTNEWIELHNTDSSAVDISGWVLKATDGSPAIELSGTVAPDGYYLLERTDDGATTQAAADQIYNGSLSNGGETLVLRDATDNQQDEVVGGDGWEVGGNNDTKETAQRAAGGWVTAAPTPGKANASSGSGSGSDDSADNGNTEDSSGNDDSAGTVTVLEPREDNKSEEDEDREDGGANNNQPDTITVNAGNDRHVLAGVQMHLNGEVVASDQSRLEDQSVSWSLGNGDTRDSADIFYTYNHPGRYVATLMVRGASRDISDQATITVTKPDIEITDTQTGGEGFIKIANNLNRDVNLSGWHLRAGGDHVTLPDYTVALANETLTISNNATDLRAVANAQLLFPDATIADTYGPNQPTSTETATNTQQAETSDEGASRSDNTPAITAEMSTATNSNEPSTTSSEQSLEALFATGSQTAAAGQAASNTGFWRWAIVTIAVIIGGVATAIIAGQLQERQERDLLSDTFDIEEM